MRDLIAEGHSAAAQGGYELAYNEHTAAQIASGEHTRIPADLDYWQFSVEMTKDVLSFAQHPDGIERFEIMLGTGLAKIDLLKQAQSIIDMQQAFAQAGLGALIRTYTDGQDASRAANLVQRSSQQLGAS